MNRTLFFRGVLVALFLMIAPVHAAVAPAGGGSHNDWVLVLAWTPQYCAKTSNWNEPQCEEGLHFSPQALTPQVAIDGMPCGSKTALTDEQIGRLMTLVQNRREARNRWVTEGGCVDLPFEQYAAQFDYAIRKVLIPETYDELESRLKTSASELRDQFVKANPGLNDRAIALHCVDGELSQVSICLSKDMGFRDCQVPKSQDNCGSRVLMNAPRPGRSLR